MAAPSISRDHEQQVIGVINQVLNEQGAKPFSKEEIAAEVVRRLPDNIWTEETQDEVQKAAVGGKPTSE